METSKEKSPEAPFVIVENGIEETASLSPLISVTEDGEDPNDKEAAKKKAEAENGNTDHTVGLFDTR